VIGRPACHHQLEQWRSESWQNRLKAAFNNGLESSGGAATPGVIEGGKFRRPGPS